MNKKKIVILGGGTNTYISNHLALSAPAYGNTAKALFHKFSKYQSDYEVDLFLTKMANPSNKDAPDTPEEVEAVVDQLIADPSVRVIVFNIAMVDYKPVYLEEQIDQGSSRIIASEFGKYTGRLSTSEHPDLVLDMTVQEKIIQKIRKTRKDIFLVGFKTTCGATQEEQFNKGLKLVKEASCNIVFANDVDKDRIKKLDKYLHYQNNPKEFLEEHKNSPIYTNNYCSQQPKAEILLNGLQKITESLRNNVLITPEESSYWYNTRDEALDALVDMTLHRIKGEFTRTTEVEGDLVRLYNSRHRLPGEIFPTSRVDKARETRYANFKYNFNVSPVFGEVLTWLVSQGAYKKNVMGKTPGHFGIKLDETTSLCSIRKQDYTDLRNLRLVKVEQKEGQIIAHGAKPSVGDATQRELFKQNPEMDFIVHFHCPLRAGKAGNIVPVTPQFNFECGSHGEISCSNNTSNHLDCIILPSGSPIYAVHLENHGPNIMFNKDTNIEELKTFILDTWDLSLRDDGLTKAEFI